MPAEYNIYVLSLCRCPWPSLSRFISDQDFHGVFLLEHLVPDIRPRQAFSRMGPAFSAMGPLGVPIGLLEAETVRVQHCPFIPRFQDLRNLPDVAQLVYIQMTLMLAFDKLVARGHVLNRPLYLLGVWTMQLYPRFSDSCSPLSGGKPCQLH